MTRSFVVGTALCGSALCALLSLASVGCSEGSASATSPITATVPNLPPELPSRIPPVEIVTNTSTRSLTVEELESEDVIDLHCYDPYIHANTEYSGVPLATLVERLAPGTTRVLLTAVDDYQVTITREEWTEHSILVATQVEGSHLTVADKGPCRIVMDFAPTDPALEQLKPKWIWQVTRIQFE